MPQLLRVRLCGLFACDSKLSNRIVARLPWVLKFRVGANSAAMLLPNAASEARSHGERGARPGTHAVLCKLSELLFVEAVRSYADTLEDSAAGGCWRSRIGMSAQPWR